MGDGNLSQIREVFAIGFTPPRGTGREAIGAGEKEKKGPHSKGHGRDSPRETGTIEIQKGLPPKEGE